MSHFSYRNLFILTIMGLLFSCEAENLPPVACFSLSPDQGDSLTVFYFDARESYDPETPGFGMRLRWDWNGDSIWDTDYIKEKEYVRRFKTGGWHQVIMEATDQDGLVSLYSDSLLIFEGNGFVDSIIDPRDGQVYSIARINYQWVMTENLRFGTALDISVQPENNGITEFYNYQNNPEYAHYGGLYNWDETMNYKAEEGNQGICPPGWHVPKLTEWKDMLGIFPSKGADMNYYWGKESPSGFNLELLGFMYYTLPPDSLLSWYPKNTVAWWCSDEPADYLQDPDDFVYSIRFFMSRWEMRRMIYRFDYFWDERSLLKFACYLRCFKDMD